MLPVWLASACQDKEPKQFEDREARVPGRHADIQKPLQLSMSQKEKARDYVKRYLE